MSWLSEVLHQCHLTDAVESYLLARGAKEASYQRIGIVTWMHPYDSDIGDEAFQKKYGLPTGIDLSDWLICPIYTTRGHLLGFEARSIERKAISEFLLSEAAWHPVWLGLDPEIMQRIWAGCDIWICEGLFDVFPLEWIVPEGDVVLGTLRAKLTRKHVEFLRRYCKPGTQIHMVYDRDEAGRKATAGFVDDSGKRRWGALEALRYVGLRCRDEPYRGGKDPGEIWAQGGVTALRGAFSAVR